MAGGSENQDNSDIPTQVPSTISIIVNIITVTETDMSTTIPTEEFLETKIGLPENPEQNLNLMVDNMIQYEG